MFKQALHAANLVQGTRPCAQQTFGNQPRAWNTFWRALLSTNESPKTLLIHGRHQTAQQVEEALDLAESYCGQVSASHGVGPRREPHSNPATFFGSGAVQEIKQLCDLHSYQKIIVNSELSGNQQKNLEGAWGRPVLDRVGLIIEIFALRARTREARLQVEMAALQHKSSRLVRARDAKSGARAGFGMGGDTEVVSARERGRSGSTSGGLGAGSGGGETELQLQRRRISSRIKALKRKLSEVRRTRTVQRRGRSRAGQPVVAVVGYTSAGKSALVSALSNTHLESRQRLFETLDPVMRRVALPSGNYVLASDTVGFISDLPHSLISSFQATLEEVVEADLLLHVLDASSPSVAQQRQAVYEVLRQLDIPESRLQNHVIEVWNKSDLMQPTPAISEQLEAQTRAQEGNSLEDDQKTDALQENTQEMAEMDFGTEENTCRAENDESAGTDRVSEDLDRIRGNAASDTAHSLDGVSEDSVVGVRSSSSEENGDYRAVCSQEETVSDWEKAQKHAVWNLIKDIHRQKRNNLQPKAVVTSSITGQGLADLLWEIDCMVSVRNAIDELRYKCSRYGPRVLKENVVGPAIRNAQVRSDLPKRLPLMQPLKETTTRRIALWQN